MKRFTLLIASILLSAYAFSQLSGTYTIGGVSPDYALFNDAVTDLNAVGVDGAVVFNVRTGTFTERIVISAIAGASSTNTITFQSETGVNTDVVLTYASTSSDDGSNYTIRLNGANYITFKDMTISRSGSDKYAVVIQFINFSHYNSLINNKIISSTYSSAISYYCSAIFCYDDRNQYNVISGNTILNGSYGIFYESESNSLLAAGIIIENNIFKNFTKYAMYLEALDAVKVTGNQISDAAGSNTYGIELRYCDNAIEVSKNKIDVSGTGANYGMYMYYCDATDGARGTIKNNFISASGGTANNGIYLYATCKYQEFRHNNVSVTGSGYPFYAYDGNYNYLYNNIFANFGGGMSIYLKVTDAIVGSDYNDLYTTGAVLGYYSGNRANIGAWQAATGDDTNSLSIDPNYASATDLHVNEASLDDAGTYITVITVDIDGEIREDPPCIGADEFSCAVPIEPTVSNDTVICPNIESITLFANSSIGISEWYDASTGGTLLGTGSTFNTPLLSITTTYYAQATTCQTVSSPRVPIVITVVPSAPAAPVAIAYPSAVLPGENTILTATGTGNGILIWYHGECGGDVIGTGPSITVTPPYSNNYFVSELYGCYSECDTLPVQVIVTCGTIAYANGVADSILICPGDTVDLSASTACDYMMMNDFNDGTMGVGWSSSCSPMFNNPCVASLDGSIYLWIGDDTNFPRELVTQQFAVTDQCQISFDMVYATQGGSSPCEGINWWTEGVHLQWSTDGGSTWTDINYWDPLGGYDPQMTSWNSYLEFVPTAAIGSNTQFRFYQDATSGSHFDHWGLDNVQITCPGNGLTVEWSHGSTELDPVADVYPTTSTTYTIITDDGYNMGNTDTSQVFIEVIGTPIAVDDQVCSAGGTAILTASGGTNYVWYDAATGGSIVGTGSSLTINPLNSNETYWVEYDIPSWGPVVYNFNSSFDGWAASAPCAPPTTWVAYDDGSEKGLYAADLASQTSQQVLSPTHNVSMYDGNILFSVNHRFNTEACCDEGYIAYKLDGGSIQRLPLITGSYTGNSALSLDPSTCAGNPTGGIYSGLQAAYVTHSGVVDVTGVNTIEFLFLFSSDGLGADDGWYINEVTIESTSNFGSCPEARAEVHATVGDLNADYSSIDVSCYGNADGQATAFAVDGVGTPTPGIYSYNWPTGATTGTITGILAGTYDVTITDAFGCTALTTATVSGPLLPTTVVDVTAVSGSCNIISPNNWVYIPNSADNTEIIASVFDATGGNDLFLTEAEATIFGAVQYYSGEPYLQRVVRVTPVSSGPATVRIYFTVAEFLALQAADPTILSINDLGVTKCDDVGSWTSPVVVPASFSVSPIGASCYYAEVTVTSFSKFYIHKDTENPLPVELIGFKAFCENGNVTFNWETTVEINNDYFTLEKSNDLITFIPVRIVEGFGNSNEIKYYSTIENNYSNGVTYYRLKQTDYDGSFSISNAIAVTKCSTEKNNIEISLYPNPAKEKLNIQINSQSFTDVEFIITDMLSKVICVQTIDLNSRIVEKTINIDFILSGIYIVKIIDKQTKEIIFTKKLIIQK